MNTIHIILHRSRLDIYILTSPPVNMSKKPVILGQGCIYLILPPPPPRGEQKYEFDYWGEKINCPTQQKREKLVKREREGKRKKEGKRG